MGQLHGKYVLDDRDIRYMTTHTALSRGDIISRFDQFVVQHPDGKIPKDEFLSTLKACYSDSSIEKLDKYVFLMCDKNNDGFIDFKESTIALYLLSSGTPKEKLELIFRIFDVNNDGTISPLEMNIRLKDLFDVMDKVQKPQNASNHISFANRLFSEMDVDGHGEVTKEEFVNACLNDEKFIAILAQKLLDAVGTGW